MARTRGRKGGSTQGRTKTSPTKTRHRTKTSDLGPNRTGVQASPRATRGMLEGVEGMPADLGGASALAFQRAAVAKVAGPVGTMPTPRNLKGAVKTVATALQGKTAAVFLDKLGERLAFERTGVRLYEALLAKVPAARTSEGTLAEEELRRFRDEELAHFRLAKEAVEQLGGDPTAVTPCADVAGVQASGLLQALTDPRTTLTQGLETIRMAELADNDGWKTLITLAEGLGQQDLARRFADALVEEDLHLQSIRRWLAERLELQLGARTPPLEVGGEPARPE